ncbi:MAG: restriction endonuclease subunit S [Pseudomonadota bacterium]
MTELPAGWANSDFGTIADIKLGKMLDKARNTGTPTPYLRNINVRWGCFDLGDLFNVPLSEEERKLFAIHDGDLLVCEGGEPGRCAVWRDGPTDIKYQKALHRVRFLEEVSPEFAAQFLFHLSLQRDLEQHFTGTTIKHLPRTAFQRVSIPLPPLAEQRRIVEKLDWLSAHSQSARDHLARVATLATRAKQATLAAAFRGELTADWREGAEEATWSEEAIVEIERLRADYEKKRRGSRLSSDSGIMIDDLGTLPHGWFRSHLAELVEMQVGHAFKSKWYVEDEGPLLVRGANVAPGRIDWTDAKRLDPDLAPDYQQFRLSSGDIVVAMDRPLISTGLKVAVVDDETAGALLVQRVARIVAGPFSSTPFIWHLLNSEIFLQHAIGRATGGDLPHISGNDILMTPVPLPSPTEQQEIVDRIETAFARIDRMAAEAARAAGLLDRLDERLLAKAFHGELVPQDPSDEPASELLARIRQARAAAPKPKRGRRKKSA